jgi:hypothetical protein
VIFFVLFGRISAHNDILGIESGAKPPSSGGMWEELHPDQEIFFMPHSQPELISIRQSRGVTLEQIAAATKISLRYLKAIEEGRLAALPGGVYTANYLRQYAEAIQAAPLTSS